MSRIFFWLDRVFEAGPSKIHAGGACNRSKARINAAASENTRLNLSRKHWATLRSFQAPSLFSSPSGEEKGEGGEKEEEDPLFAVKFKSPPRDLPCTPRAKPVSLRSSLDSLEGARLAHSTPSSS